MNYILFKRAGITLVTYAMREKPEKYYYDKTVISIIAQRYPDIPEEIRLLLEWYRPRTNTFKVTNSDGGVEIFKHQDIYDRLTWTRGYRSDPEAVKCNTQMLNFLRQSLGWCEDNIRKYPNPHNVV